MRALKVTLDRDLRLGLGGIWTERLGVRVIGERDQDDPHALILARFDGPNVRQVVLKRLGIAARALKAVLKDDARNSTFALVGRLPPQRPSLPED
jgi:hypothetical protein